MALAEAHATQGDSAGGHGATGEPSVSSAVEHLVASRQRVMSKRIDLALLEGAGDMLTAFGIIGTEMILGLPLSFAPKAGHEIRLDIAEKVGEIGEHLRAQAPRRTAPTNPPSRLNLGHKGECPCHCWF